MLETIKNNLDSDHDLLVRLDTKLDALSISFNEIKISVAQKADARFVDITLGEIKGTLAGKADASDVSKIDDRLDKLRMIVYSGVGGLAVLQFLLHYLLAPNHGSAL